MLDDIVPLAFLFLTAFTIVGVTKVIADARTRRRLIEGGASPELAAAVALAMRSDPRLHETLRWALVLGAVGLALIILQFLPYRFSDPIALGLVLLFAAGGLLAYYATARRATTPAHPAP